MIGKTIGVISIKGGVGKTTAITNLGAALADEFDKKVLLVDANFSAPNLGLHLGNVKPESTLFDVIIDKIGIRKAIAKHDSGFDYIPGSLLHHKIDKDIYQLKKKIDSVRRDYDLILIDTAPATTNELLSAMIASDELLVVTTPDYPTLSCTIKAIKLAKERKTPIIGLILNKTRGKKFELTAEDIENIAEVPVLAVIPDDISILEALSLSKPQILHAPRRESSIEYKKLASSLIGADYKDPRMWKRMKKLFETAMTNKAPKHEVNRTLLKRLR
jgi:septum site-determining protein MinD